MSTDRCHILTNSIYRSIGQNFRPAVQQLIQCGKVYRKALLGTSAAAKAYIDSILMLGLTTKATDNRGIDYIGDAMQNIAEIHRQMQLKSMEEANAILSELIMPLESTLDGIFQTAATRCKRYHRGNKVLSTQLRKEEDGVRRLKKKSKIGYYTYKEMEYAQVTTRHSEQLDEYRLEALKWALTDEHESYCLVLDKLCVIEDLHLQHHMTAVDKLSEEIQTWKDAAANAKELPQEAKNILATAEAESLVYKADAGSIMSFADPYDINSVSDLTIYRSIAGNSKKESQYIQENSEPVYQNVKNALAPPIPQAMPPKETNFSCPQHDDANTEQDSNHEATIQQQPIHYASTPIINLVSKSATPDQNMNISVSGRKVQAISQFCGEESNKLSFEEGDVLTLIWDTSDGWQYGYNSATKRFGWFPLSFTNSLNNDPSSHPPEMRTPQDENDLVADCHPD